MTNSAATATTTTTTTTTTTETLSDWVYVNIAFLVLGFSKHPHYGDIIEAAVYNGMGEVDLIEQVGKFANDIQKAYEDATIDRSYGYSIYAYSVAQNIGTCIAEYAHKHSGKLPSAQQVYDEALERTRLFLAGPDDE